MSNNNIKYIFNISFSLLFFLFFFIFVDILFSNFIYKKELKIRYDCFSYKNYSFNDNEYNDYELLKNCVATEKQRTVVPYTVYTDINGYRYSGKERFLDRKNLVFLGDSFTYGYGVKFEHSFPGIIQSKVKNYEVYNLAVPGYGIQKYAYRLKEFFKNKKASKIFLTLDMTDINDAAFRWIKIPNSESPVLKSKHINKDITNWKNFKNSNFKGTKLLVFYLRNSIRYIKLKLKPSNMGDKDTALRSDIANFTYTKLKDNSRLDKNNLNKSISIINEHFKEISNLANKNNAELYLIICPWPETLIYGQEVFNWENFSNKLCEDHNCKKVINLFSDFNEVKQKNKNWKHLIYIDDDIHLKKFGANLVANKVIEEIVN